MSQILLKLWLIGNRTSCRPIRSVIILVIKQIGLPLRGRPILLITRMITDQIGLHSVLLPLQITLFFIQNYFCSRSRHSCSKSHNFCLKSQHFCFEYKMRCKSPFVYAFQPTGYLTNKLGTDWILRFQNGRNKVVIELRVWQFWSKIILVISQSNSRYALVRARPIVKSRVWRV